MNNISTQIIPVFTGQLQSETVQLCDARVLHRFLKAGRRFASWITDRVREYGFLENQDFVIVSQNRETIRRYKNGERQGTSVVTDYHITLDMAKELAMVERTDQGRMIRQYFIECERRLHKIAPNELIAAMQSVIAPSQKQILKSIVDRRVGEALTRVPTEKRKSVTGSLYQKTWRGLHTHFGVNEYSALSMERFDEAREYLETVKVEWELLEPESKNRRELVIADENGTRVIDVTGYNLIKSDHARGLRRDMAAMSTAMTEMQRRIGVCFGEANPSCLSDPLDIRLQPGA